MYTYVSATLRERGANKRYVLEPVKDNLSVSNTLMRNIFKYYIDGWFTLIPPAFSNSGTINPQINGRSNATGATYWQIDTDGNVITRWLKGPNGAFDWTDIGVGGTPNVYVYLNLLTLKSAAVKKNPGLTVLNWLAGLTNTTTGQTVTLPTVTQKPTYSTTRVLYSDAFKARYNVQRVHPTAPPSNPYPLGELTDLLIGRTGVTDTLVHNNCMFSVNGLFHMTDLSIYGVKVKDGGKTCDISKRNNVGVLSFRNIGTIQHAQVDSGMMFKPSVLFQSKQTVWLNTGINMTNKTALLVLGGYLHVLDDVYSVINPEQGIIQINIDKINLLHRLFESREIIDLSSLLLSTASYNDKLVALGELYSEDVIVRLIDLSQTFVVLVNKPSLYTEQHILSKTGINGVYMSPVEPMFPLRGSFGAFPEYWSHREYDQWILSIENGLTPNYLFETTQWQEYSAVDDTLDNGKHYNYMIAHLLEIGNETVTLT